MILEAKGRLVLWAALGLVAVGVLGCGGKSAASLSARNDKLFQTADPVIKSCWNSATAALKTNGYVVAIISLREITQGTNTTITPDQLNAANETVTAISDAMYRAANKGDAKAKEAIEDLRKSMGR